jgi:hypothetical protein
MHCIRRSRACRPGRWFRSRWTFVAPKAVLHPNAGDDGVVVINFGVPTW